MPRFESCSKSWMALAPFMRNEKYKQFFVRKIKSGDFVILDNGAYEGDLVSSQEYADMIRELKPSVYVLPDVPGQFAESMKSSSGFLNRFGIRGESDPLWVVHGKDGDLDQLTTSYCVGAMLCPWVGFSRLTNHFGLTSPHWRRRVDFIQYLQSEGKWGEGAEHHALGMLDGCMRELPLLAASGIYSIDSSAPIWRGLHGYCMDSKWPGFSFRPELGHTPSESNLTLASSNLSHVQESCCEHTDWKSAKV